MRRNILISVFCLLALFICYRVEQRIYETRTFSYLQQKKIEDGTKEMKKVMMVSQSEQEALDENQNYKQQQQKTAYLTFDDGPSKVTKEVLQTLKENNIHATFFLIGSQINDDTKDIVQQLVEDGHTIGIHTYSHEGKAIYKSKKAYLEDFHKAADTIKEFTGLEPRIFRFPWGSVNKYLGSSAKGIIEELESEGYTYFDWNVSAEDSVGKPTADSILRNINKDYVKYKQPIILMHDSSINQLSAKMLPKIIKSIKESGYGFDTLDKMEKPYQYPRD